MRYERVLDMRNGVLERDLVWATPSGRHVQVRSRRLVSFEHRHVVGLCTEVTSNRHASVTIRSRIVNRSNSVARSDPPPRSIDPRLGTRLGRALLDPAEVLAEDERIVLGYRTAQSGMTLGLAVEHVLDAASPYTVSVTADADLSEFVVEVDAEPGVPIRLTKYAAYHTADGTPTADLVQRCRRTLARVVPHGFEALIDAQRRCLDRFWDRADVTLEDTERHPVRMQQAMRWNLFHLAQASWRAEGTGIPARGLTGDAYDGHYFWDTETWVLPFLAYTQPRIARNVLRFRHGMLPAARARASELDLRGAVFPWRTIRGDEASAIFQAGTAQFHINADIAYAIRRYTDVRGEIGFLAETGAEILVETARMWLDLGFYGEDGRFHIHGVTGPDEYTALVEDNAFTNLMARLNLHYAASSLRRLEAERPYDHAGIVEQLGLSASELDDWDRAADLMYVPYDADRGITPQDATFLTHEVWDLATTPSERFPLMLHYHPIMIYQRQVLKQADVVMAMFLLGNEFSLEQKRRNFEYYDPITTGDSSLSASIQSIVASEIGAEDAACRYLDFALLIDLADVTGQVSSGVHLASAAGGWMGIVFGFGGVRDFDGNLSIDPRLPRRFRSVGFSLRFHDRQLRVHLSHERERFELTEGEPLELEIRGRHQVLRLGAPLELDVASMGVEAVAPFRAVIDPARVDAVIFDLDGVLTDTASVHATAWKRTFDDLLRSVGGQEGVDDRPFDAERDYRTFVDGRLRQDGVAAFLESRGITLPVGESSDAPDRDTVWGVANRKNRAFGLVLRQAGVDAYSSSVDFVRALRSAGISTAVVSASRNASQVLDIAGIAELFDERVDGLDAERLGLPGKPEPDLFLEAARRLGVAPARAVVLEDAPAGVEAGRAGAFGLVVGVDRQHDPAPLLARGADVVVRDLAELRVS
ncbi:MAG: beta-phosphoglucomutase family hydrolase [Actinomycetota bacterium]|nr:beta-phosphoglucomutase family hydrolase [Actinomycetota bacterium]